MKVKRLIQELLKLPENSEVYHLWDGELRTAINVVYESKDGRVVTSDYDQVCYSNDARPKDAPTEEENKYWKTEDIYDVNFSCAGCGGKTIFGYCDQCDN